MRKLLSSLAIAASLIFFTSLITADAYAFDRSKVERHHHGGKHHAKDKSQKHKSNRQENRHEKRVDRKHKVKDRKQTRHQRRHDHRYHNRHHTHRHYHRHRVGFHVTLLPKVHVTFTVGSQPYYYSSGVYYRPARGGYVVVAAPLGATLVTLPYGYVDFYIGPSRYYYVNRTYYVYEPQTTKYIVVEKPEDIDETELESEIELNLEDSQSDSGTTQLIIYPNRGQDENQQSKDRYECYLWGSKEVGYDPVTADNHQGRPDYQRALVACLEGRNYTVSANW